MVIDTSAVIAMLTDEPDAARYEAAVEADPVRLMSTATYVETAIVVESRYGDAGGRELDLWLHRASVDLVPVQADHALMARAAYRRFGKGSHPAGLNYGDSFSYALSHASSEPLLCKGDDFPLTDITLAEVPVTPAEDQEPHESNSSDE